ncbi:hypothetical protein PUNSTDRAFT_141030 [Punctularia strigosozonata HHB-11173 SS5]|uniref:uncharacterized protein n=1 Tax=Punctularia strigosozonata (strain HHB-11173) TaxID=741275 RepID=UPI0004417C82|nr:uncharacterized protein PUNSTDRAFT_141030 [Punctularia strigosozonata HHB-11173 SS5]EIN12225.1 hypothetical protein PUNSTDRAFT_141030 [Punctularia strigosozonata HHB-11173 SS5]
MTVFYPDNVPRADRLQQLINNIGVLQTDISQEKARMDELDEKSQTILNALLKEGKIKTLAALKNEAMSKLTDEQKHEFEALISSTKEVAKITETMLWIGLLLGGGKLVSLGSKAIMALVRGIAAIQAVRAIVTAFVEAIPGLARGAAAVGEAVANAAARARAIAQTGKEAAGLVGQESKVARLFKFLGKIGKWLSWFGVVLVGVAPLIEVIVGGQQKDKLIEGIHETQVVRLVIDAIKQQARHVTEQMSTSTTYLNLLNKGQTGAASAIAEDMIDTIKEEDSKINLNKLEADLRDADNSTVNKYFKDDWDVATVVEKAEKEREKDAAATALTKKEK